MARPSPKKNVVVVCAERRKLALTRDNYQDFRGDYQRKRRTKKLVPSIAEIAGSVQRVRRLCNVESYIV